MTTQAGRPVSPPVSTARLHDRGSVVTEMRWDDPGNRMMSQRPSLSLPVGQVVGALPAPQCRGASSGCQCWQLSTGARRLPVGLCGTRALRRPSGQSGSPLRRVGNVRNCFPKKSLRHIRACKHRPPHKRSPPATPERPSAHFQCNHKRRRGVRKFNLFELWRAAWRTSSRLSAVAASAHVEAASQCLRHGIPYRAAGCRV